MKTTPMKEFYDNRIGDKCSLTHYYRLIKQGKSMDEAIQPIENPHGCKKGKIQSNCRNKELFERYHAQPEPKTNKDKFYQRVVVRGWTKETAIIDDYKLEKIKSKPGRKVTQRKKENVFTKAPEDEEIKRVKIKYSKEEAQAFRKIYQLMIDDLEKQMDTEDLIELIETRKKLEHLKKEIYLFNTINEGN